MANRRFDRGWCLGERLVRIAGSFGTNGGAAITASSVRGFGFGFAPTNGVMALQARVQSSPLTSTPGIVLSGTGVYTVTLEDTYIEVVSVLCDLQLAAQGSNLWAQAGPIVQGTSTTAPTFQILIVNGSGVAQAPPAADANNRVNFQAILRDSTVQFNKP